MGKHRIEHGHIFAVPLPDGTYLHGRVMLDIYAATKRKLFPEDSPLPGLGRTLLIEMYTEPLPKKEYVPSRVLIPGAFIDSDSIGVDWPVVGHKPVEPLEVQFPETLLGYSHDDGDVAFVCGEIRIFIQMTSEEHEEIGVYPTIKSTSTWKYVCLHQLGRDADIPKKHQWSASHLQRSDLRFTEHRVRVCRLLSLDMNDSYYEQQAKLGLHLERLYE